MRAAGARPEARPQKWTTCGDSNLSAVSRRSESWISAARCSRHGRIRPYFTVSLSLDPVSWFGVGLVSSVPNTSNRIALHIKRLCAIERMRATSEGLKTFAHRNAFAKTGGATPPGLPQGSAADVDVAGVRGGRREQSASIELVLANIERFLAMGEPLHRVA